MLKLITMLAQLQASISPDFFVRHTAGRNHHNDPRTTSSVLQGVCLRGERQDRAARDRHSPGRLYPHN